MSRSPSATTALILVDHGSKLDEANRLLEPIAKSIRSKSDYIVVEIAHMELAPPTLAQAYARCIQAGAQEIVIAPYFLASGNHATSDIPRMAAEAAAAHPDVQWRLAEPLGFDERIVNVVLERAAEAKRQD